MAFKFNAEVRQAQGKGASRRLRHNGQIPAINNDELLVFFLFGQSAVKFEIVLGVFSNEDSLRH